MNVLLQKFWPSLAAVFTVALVISAGCSTMSAGTNEGIKVKLSWRPRGPSGQDGSVWKRHHCNLIG